MSRMILTKLESYGNREGMVRAGAAPSMASGSWPRAVRRVLGWVAIAAGAAAAFYACGGSTGVAPILGGESHFLRHCSERCGDGLDCISGVCTRACIVGQESCAAYSEGAICTADSVEPGAVAVCDVACSTANDCSGLGSSHACEGGYCRAPESAPMSGGTGGSAGGGDSDGEICSTFANEPGDTELSILVNNGGSVPLYLWSRRECGPLDYPFAELRAGAQIVDIDIASCRPSCEEYVGAGAYLVCTSDCAFSRLIRIEPGATYALSAIASRVTASAIPSSCVGGEPAERETEVGCFRQRPLEASTYEASVFALVSPDIEGCTGYDCTPDASGTCATNFSCVEDVDPTSVIGAQTSFNFPSETTVTITFGAD
jgi:hypothetical protein